MHFFSFLRFLIVAAFLLNACPASGAVPGAFIESKESDGPLVHRDSGFVFPLRIGTFRRAMPRQYDDAGHDVSVAYNHETLPRITATLYVYPTGGVKLEQEFARRQTEVTTYRPKAQLVSRGEATMTPRRVQAFRADYAFDDQIDQEVQPLRSVLLVAQDGPRFVEYRFTYPAADEAAAAPLVKQLIQDYAWR